MQGFFQTVSHCIVGWLIPFWIANCVEVAMRCIIVACKKQSNMRLTNVEVLYPLSQIK